MKYKKPQFLSAFKRAFYNKLRQVGACFFVCFFVSSAVFGADRGNGIVRFAYLADVHISIGTTNIEDLENSVKDINALNASGGGATHVNLSSLSFAGGNNSGSSVTGKFVDFVIVAGDVTEFGSDEEIALAKSILDKLTVPYYIVSGNHDSKWSESGCNTFAKVFGYETFDFEAGGFRFIGCNSGPNMRMAPALVPRESMVWLDSVTKVIPKGTPVIFVNHYPLTDEMLNYAEVLEFLSRTNIQLALCGHGHNNHKMSYLVPSDKNRIIRGAMGRSNLRAGRAGSGYNIVTIDSLRITLAERVNGETLEPWCSYDLISEVSASDSARAFDTVRASDSALASSAALTSDSAPTSETSLSNADSPVKPIWVFRDNSDIGSGAVYADGVVYFANTAGYVKALDAISGTLLWSYKTGGKIFSTPAVSKGRLVVGCTDGYIYCFDIEGISLRNLEAELQEADLQKGVSQKVELQGADLQKGASQKVKLQEADLRKNNLRKSSELSFSENAVGGSNVNRLIWKVKAEKSVLPAPAIYKGVVYIGASDGKFRALRLSDGSPVWIYDGVKGFVEAKALVDKEGVYFGDWQNRFYALNPKSGKPLWIWSNNKSNRMLSPAAVWPVKAHGKVFIVTPERVIYALSAVDGREVWSAKGGRESIGISSDGNAVYVKTMQDSVFAWSTLSDTPVRLWSSFAGFGYEIAPSPITVHDGLLFVPTDKGNIFALRESDGALVWKYKFSIALINYIQPIAGNRLLVTSMDGKVGVLQL